MANHSASNPGYQRIGIPDGAHHRASNETKLFIIIDSRAPITLTVPIAPGQLTLKAFKDFTSLHNDCYKFYFQSHDAEFGTVKEEIVEDDAVLPNEDGRIVVWVLSNDSTQSAALFEPVVDSNRSEEFYQPGRRAPISSFASNNTRINGQHAISSQPSSPANNYNGGFNFANGKRSTPPESPTCLVISLHLDHGQPLGLSHVYPGDDCQTNGIIVDHVQHNSIAQRDGRIQSGDRIVEVNGVELRYLSLGDALRIYRQFVEQGGDINLVIQKPSGMLKLPPQPPLKTSNFRPCVPPRPPIRDPFLIHSTQQNSPEIKVGFDPATELPDPLVEPDQLPDLGRYGIKTTKSRPIDLRNGNNQEHQRASQSLPRSLTRSWYTTGNLDNTNPSANLGIYQMDSRSDYETTTPPASLRSNLYQVPLHCGRDNIETIYAALKADSTSLDVKDREWLKVVVGDAFLGSTLIKWLSRNIYGFCNRSEVKRYANQMLAIGLIRSPMSKSNFSEKCFYTLT